MGTILTVAGADFSANAIGYNAPNVRGLTGLYIEGNTLAGSIKNLASGGASGAAAVGSPVVGTGYTEGSFGNYILTPVPDSASETMVLAVRVASPPASAVVVPHFAGSYFSNKGNRITGQNGTLGLVSFGSFTPTGGGTAVGISAVGALSAAAAWNLIAFVQDDVAKTVQIINLTSGVAGTAVATGGTAALGSNGKWLGSSPAATASVGAGPADVALAEFHNVALTTAELSALYAAWKPVLSNRGIAI